MITGRSGSLFLIAFLFILIALSYDSVHGQETTSVSVSVAASMNLDVSPNASSFTSLSINSTATPQTLTLQNIGSQPITTISVHVSNDPFQVYGTDNASAYDAGNLAQIDNTTGGTFFQVNRNEFNETLWPGYVIVPSTATAFFRVRVGGDGEYFAVLQNTTTGGSGCHNGTLAITNVRHTQTESGAVNMSAETYTQLLGDSDDSHGLADFTIGGLGYCVAVTNNCEELEWFKWNNNQAPYDDNSRCTNDDALLDTTMNPGNTTDIRLRVAVPFGVPDGSLNDGTITFTAS